MKRFVNYLLIIIFLAANSCSNEYPVIPQPENDQKSVTLRIAVPYAIPKGVSMRAIGAPQENAIESLYVLAFKVDNGVETFLYSAEAKKSVGNSEGAPSQSFNVKLFVKSFPQRFVLITNARTKIDNLLSSRPDGWVGQEKEGMLSQLTVDLNGSDRWNATSASNYTAIPMWGETAPKVITQGATTISDTPIPLLRMVAKIEVQLDQSVQGLTDLFKLKSVHLYNTNTSGRIVPKPGIEYVGTDIIAKKASLPAVVTSVVGPLAYTDFSLPGSLDVAMKGAIYLFETAAKNTGNFLGETCIVVGGIYGTDSQESYYRLDFFASNGTTHVDILRNHSYSCKIVAVGGRGYATVGEAFSSRPSNMTAELIVWDDGQIHYIVFDDSYMLGVSQNYFSFNDEAHKLNSTDNILKVTTDYPSGWKATVWADLDGTIPVPNDATSGQPWLSITPTLGPGGAQITDMRLMVEANNSSYDRTAYIHITAGRLSCIVKVMQTMNDVDVITVTPTAIELPYPAQTPASPTLSVTAKKMNNNPAPNATWTLYVPTSVNWLKLSLNANGSNPQTILNGIGSQTVYLVVTANTGTSLRSSVIYLNNPTGNVVSTISQKYMETIGQTGSAGPRIYIESNGGNPRLMLTQDPTNKGAMFQFGGVRGWNFSSSGSAGSANYNPTTLTNTWNSSWQYANSQYNTVQHTLANLRDGKGDPCRLVGYTQQEIRDAISTSNANAYAPDNKQWKLPDGSDLDSYTVKATKTTMSGVTGYEVGPSSSRTFLPVIGHIVPGGSFSTGDGYYWSSSQKTPTGTPSSYNANYLWLLSSSDLATLNADSQALGASIRCVRQ